MMRRQSFAAPSILAASCVRTITAWNIHKPMDQEFLPASHYPSRKEIPNTPVRVSKLPNGARVVTHDQHGPQISVGAYFEAGAIFDPSSVPGLNYVLRWAISGSNMENSLFQIDRNIRAVGASREHTEVRKRWLGLKVECPAGRWERPTADIFSSIASPRFPEYDIERFRDTMDNLLEEQRWNQPREYSIDQLETVAFFREPLGNPRYVPASFNDKASHSAVLASWAKYCQPSRVVIAGVNVDHDALIAAYENAPMSHSSSAPHHAKSENLLETTRLEIDQFNPGYESHEQEGRAKAMGTKPDCEDETIIAVGFPAPGFDNNVKQYAAGLVLRQLASIAFGETLAINRVQPRHGTESFYRPYSTGGLFGATIRTTPSDSASATQAAVKAIRKLDLSADSIKFAAARAICAFGVEHLEVGRDYLDFLGTSLITSTINRVSVEDIISSIGQVDAATLKPLVDKFNSTRPALFATGEVVQVPSLRQLGF